MEEQRVKDSLRELGEMKSKHLPLAEKILRAQSAAMYPFDFFAIAVIKRSMSLIRGFSTLTEQHNYTCSVTLLRMQLDNCLRLHASNICPNVDEFLLKVISGVPIRRIKDRNGKLMTDAYLVEQLSKDYPWVERTYAKASGFVHLSDSHIFIAKEQASTPGSHAVRIADNDEHLPPQRFVSAIRGFMAATGIVFEYLEAWAWVKDNAELAEASRQVAEYRDKVP